MRSLFRRTASVSLVLLSVFLSGVSLARAQLVLYASDAGASQLYTLNPASGAATLVGSYGFSGTMGGLAYDPINDILFGSDVSTNSLYRINQSTGAATLVGPFGVGVMQALAFDPTSGNLYGAYGSTATPTLYRIDPLTGAASLVGGLNQSISGLTFDPLSHVLYGSSTSLNNAGVFTLNLSTGQNIAQVSTGSFNGISFDPTSGTLYGISNGGNVLFGGPAQGLYTINSQTGSTSLIGATSLSNPLDLQFALRRTAAAAPEPGSLALLLPVPGIVGGMIRKRRKRNGLTQQQ